MLYRIKDWERSYENADTRKLKHLNWTRTTTKLASRSYSHVTAHPRACEILAAFGAMVKIAANAPRRGYLEDHDGALDAADMAAITRLPVAAFEVALEVCTSEKVGWVETVGAQPAEAPAAVPPVTPTVSGESPDINAKPGESPENTEKPGDIGRTPAADQKRLEEKRSEGKGITQTPSARAKAAGIELPADRADQVRVLLGAVMVGSHGFQWGVGAQGPSAQATVTHMVETAGGDVDPVVLELHGLYKLGPPGKSFKAATYISELLHWREKRQEEKPKGNAPETFDRKRYADLAR